MRSPGPPPSRWCWPTAADRRRAGGRRPAHGRRRDDHRCGRPHRRRAGSLGGPRRRVPCDGPRSGPRRRVRAFGHHRVWSPRSSVGSTPGVSRSTASSRPTRRSSGLVGRPAGRRHRRGDRHHHRPGRRAKRVWVRHPDRPGAPGGGGVIESGRRPGLARHRGRRPVDGHGERMGVAGGAAVQAVASGSPAATGGLEADDVITAARRSPRPVQPRARARHAPPQARRRGRDRLLARRSAPRAHPHPRPAALTQVGFWPGNGLRLTPISPGQNRCARFWPRKRHRLSLHASGQNGLFHTPDATIGAWKRSDRSGRRRHQHGLVTSDQAHGPAERGGPSTSRAGPSRADDPASSSPVRLHGSRSASSATCSTEDRGRRFAHVRAGPLAVRGFLARPGPPHQPPRRRRPTGSGRGRARGPIPAQRTPSGRSTASRSSSRRSRSSSWPGMRRAVWVGWHGRSTPRGPTAWFLRHAHRMGRPDVEAGAARPARLPRPGRGAGPAYTPPASNLEARFESILRRAGAHHAPPGRHRRWRALDRSGRLPRRGPARSSWRCRASGSIAGSRAEADDRPHRRRFERRALT